MGAYRFISAVMLFILTVVLLQLFLSLSQAANPHIRKIPHRDLEVRLDLSTQVLSLDILVDKEGIGYPMDMDPSKNRSKEEATLYPTIKSACRGNPHFISASLFMAKAKQFDDGLIATVEYLCQQGTENFPGKQWLLQRIADALQQTAQDEELAEDSKNSEQGVLQQLSESLEEILTNNHGSLTYCQGLIAAAASLGGQEMSPPNAVKTEARNIKSKFLNNQLRSKPIGFYTWTEELSQIFQQDRLLQTVFDPNKEEEKEVITILGNQLSRDTTAKSFYNKYLSFIQKLTNPFPTEYNDITQMSPIQLDKQYCFYPPSQAHETELGKKLYGNQPIPEGFSLIDALIKRIQEGEIDLQPKDDSGWYDYQVYALEPFVKFENMPEAEKIDISDRYKEELIDLFKASIALTRESHVKQLEIPICGSAYNPIIKIYPELSIEPIATYFLRRAESYRFARKLLESTFGHSVLGDTYRLTPSVKVSKPLLDELNEMESLFHGAYQIVSAEIGLEQSDQRMGNEEEDKQFAKEWTSQVIDDPDIGTDNRMMVPVFYDIQRKKTKVWVVMGYAAKPLEISFKQPPQAEVFDARGKKVKAELEFKTTQRRLVYPVSAEIYVDRILNRDEFRSLCDKYKTRSAIISALSN